MAKPVIWSHRAFNDRKTILEYWTINNQSAAYSKKLNLLFRRAVRLISTHPHIGRKTDVENIRMKLVLDYQIIYEQDDNRIIVLAIWHTKRNPDEFEKIIR